MIACQPELGERDRLIEKLQVVALARGPPRLHRALTRAQAVHPEKYSCRYGDNRPGFPHAGQLLAARRKRPLDDDAIIDVSLPRRLLGAQQAFEIQRSYRHAIEVDDLFEPAQAIEGFAAGAEQEVDDDLVGN